MDPDELDKALLDQLHAATLKASDSCFEMKKLCATVLVPTGTLVSIFTDKKLNVVVFVAALLVIGIFWLADAVGYFYQRRLRSVMDGIWERRASRCRGGWDFKKTGSVTWFGAAFNNSMIYYLVLALPVALALIAVPSGALKHWRW